MVLLRKQTEKTPSAGGANPDAEAGGKIGASGKIAGEGKKAGLGKNEKAQVLSREPVPGCITSREIGHWLCRLVRDAEQPFVGLDEATVARDVYKDIERAGREAARDANRPVDLDAWRWHIRTAVLANTPKWLDLQEVLREEHPTANLVGLITWDPLATWIANAHQSDLVRLRRSWRCMGSPNGHAISPSRW